ncbi:MAG: hypothetical protein Q8N51_16150 [Gammaproteobacteria bacterium]|nr:hypothetical protein [Gammaproteobacteria bacterium]
MSKASTHLLVFAALLVTPLLQMEVRADSTAPISIRSDPVTAQFRGCESAGWCRVWIASLDPLAQSLHRVYPDGMPETAGSHELAIAVRNRLNALMSSFVHQHKRIVLYGLRERGDGTWAANITVNESNLSEDPELQALRQ